MKKLLVVLALFIAANSVFATDKDKEKQTNKEQQGLVILNQTSENDPFSSMAKSLENVNLSIQSIAVSAQGEFRREPPMCPANIYGTFAPTVTVTDPSTGAATASCTFCNPIGGCWSYTAYTLACDYCVWVDANK